MTQEQKTSLIRICERYNTEFKEADFRAAGNLDGLPERYVVGWVAQKIYIGVSPEGEISS